MPLPLFAVLLLAAGGPNAIKLAMPGLSSVNIDEKTGDLYADFFAQHLLETGGIRITTKSEVGSLLGFERQRQMLGCAESNCLAEMAGALGVDGVIVGNLGRLGREYVITLKVVAASDGRTLGSASGRFRDEEGLLDWLGKTAKTLGAQVKEALDRQPPALPHAAPELAATTVSAGPEPSLRSRAWIPCVAGAALAATGGVFYGLAASRANQVSQGRGGYPTAAALDSAISEGSTFQTLGFVLIGAGLAAGAAGGAMYLWGGNDEKSAVALAPSPGGVVLVGRWP